MSIREFVCADCKVEVFAYDGALNQTACDSCMIIREMKAHGAMTPDAEAALRELLGNVIPVSRGDDGAIEIVETDDEN